METVERIYALIEEKGMRVNFILEKIGKSESYFRQIKTGKASIPAGVLAQIAEILGTTVEYLKGETDDPNIPEKAPAEISDVEGVRAINTILSILTKDEIEDVLRYAIDCINKRKK